MFSTLNVTSAASATRLISLEQIKIDLGLADDNDALYERVIDFCSDEISAYLRRGVDEDEKITLGRETVTEVFYQTLGQSAIHLSRWPLGNVTSIREGTAAAIARTLSNTDGAITATDNTFTSAGGPGSSDFTDSYVGKAITISGAGASGADLTTTIASVTSETEVELTDAASTTVSGASYTVDNPAFAYVVRKQRGEVRKISGSYLTNFYVEPITVVYTAGWLLPGETGRNLPVGIEDACRAFCKIKIGQIQEGEDFSGALTAASVDGVGSFTFAGSEMKRGNGIPYEVRALLDRYFEPVFA